MNEKQIEIALAKLRKLYKQTKTIKGREAICFAAKALKQGITGSLIPLSFNESDKVTMIHSSDIPARLKAAGQDSPKPFNPDSLDLYCDDAGNVLTRWAKKVVRA